MAVGDVDRLAQVVLDADHPVGEQVVHRRQVRVERPDGRAPATRRARSAGIALTNQSASKRVRRPAASTSCTRWDPAPARLVAASPCRRRSARPRPRRWVTHGSIQASLVGRSSTRSSSPSLPCGRFEDERLAHVADRAGAGHGLLGSDQVAGQAGREDLLVLLRLSLRADEVPPADVLPLAEAALVAAGDEHQQRARRSRRARAAGRRAPRAPRSGSGACRRRVSSACGSGPKPKTDRRRHGHRRAGTCPPWLRPGCPRRRWRCRRTAYGASSPGRGGRSRGKTGSRARRAGLAFTGSPCRGPGCCAPCRPALALEDGDVEAALDELVSGGEAGHAAAEDGHGSTRSPREASGAPSCPMRAVEPTTAEAWSTERRVRRGEGADRCGRASDMP